MLPSMRNAMDTLVIITLLALPMHCHEHNQRTNSTMPSTAAERELMKVNEENRVHIDQAIETLINPDSLRINSNEAGHLQPVYDNRNQQAAERLTYSSSGDDYSLDMEADISLMNATFDKIFSKPRSDGYSKRLKESARNAILAKFREFKLEPFTQSFTATKRGQNVKGLNLIGVLPGRFRDVQGMDKIVLLGAHYDTVDTSPGVDDNGSGMVAALEVARILGNKPQLNHTVMFVAFDLEELGLLGSTAFVREYLIPKELVARRSNFLGAYVIDMVLNFDSSPNSQVLPRDIMTGTPDITRKIGVEGNRGDFVAVWMRNRVDDDVFETLSNEWRKSKDGSLYKLRAFEPALPSRGPTPSELQRYGTFTRSDHASFWYHKHNQYTKTLNAVLLTDMGPWRGIHKKCYHSWCDDQAQLGIKNLNFLKHTIDVLARTIAKGPSTSLKQPQFPPIWTTASPRSFRGGRGRGSRFHWF